MSVCLDQLPNKGTTVAKAVTYGAVDIISDDFGQSSVSQTVFLQLTALEIAAVQPA